MQQDEGAQGIVSYERRQRLDGWRLDHAHRRHISDAHEVHGQRPLQSEIRAGVSDEDIHDCPRAEVVLLRGLGHCAGEKFLRVAPFIVTWLRARLRPGTGSRVARRMTRWLLPRAA